MPTPAVIDADFYSTGGVMYIAIMWLKVKEWLRMLPKNIVKGFLSNLSDHDVQEVISIEQGLDNEVVTLSKPFHAYGLTVPAGYTYNGASSPRLAWFIIPRMYKMLKASCRHDYACDQARCWWDRLVADIVFFLMAYYIEHLALWRCVLGLIGVRIGAFLGIGRRY